MSGVVSPDLGCSLPTTTTRNKNKRSVPDYSTSYKSDPMMTEHLALIGFAARLGTTITRDAAEATTTRSDAQLLMSLLHSSSASPSSAALKNTETQLSENGISPRSINFDYEYNGLAASGTPNSDAAFTFTCPSLSIDADQQRAKRTMTTKRLTLADDGEVSDDTTGTAAAATAPRPSQLLGRTIVTTQRDGVSEAVEAMARNILQAFSVALEWRYSAWVGSLTKVLRLKKSLMAQHTANLKKAAQAQGGENNDAKKDVRKNEGDEEDNDNDDDEEDDGYDYAEAKAIDFLARAISEVSVIDVKTSFRVLHQDDQELLQPKKRIKVRQVTLEGNGRQQSQQQGVSARMYERSSPLSFEATLTVLSGAEEKHIVLKTSGNIIGTFASSAAGGEGEEVLTKVGIKLDTNSLALCMEEQSRLFVRSATEAAMGPKPQILDLTQPEEPCLQSPGASVVSINIRPEAVIVTPKPGNSPSSPFSSAGNVHQVIEDLTIPLPSVPCLDSDDAASPTRMSPTQQMGGLSTPDTSASQYLFSPKQTISSSSLPKLVSPSPVHQAHSDAEDGPRAEESEWYSYQGGGVEEKAKPDGPSLPALVEVACAAIASTTS